MPSVFEDRQVLVFVSVLAAAMVIAGAVFFLNVINPVLFAVLLLIAAGIAAVFPRFVEFREYERGVVFRTGKFRSVVGPGWIWVLPTVDKYTLVDLRVQAAEVKAQKVISQDGVIMTIDPAVNFRIKDPAKFVLNARNNTELLNRQIVTAMRDTASRHSYTDILAHTDVMAQDLQKEVQKEAEGWGIEITLADIKEVVLPKDLLDAMRLKEQAMEKRDAIETQASIKQIYLKALDETASKLSPQTLSYLYIEALRKMAFSRSSKIVVPFDFSKAAPEGIINAVFSDKEKSKK